jgi:hypothetical protein
MTTYLSRPSVKTERKTSNSFWVFAVALALVLALSTYLFTWWNENEIRHYDPGPDRIVVWDKQGKWEVSGRVLTVSGTNITSTASEMSIILPAGSGPPKDYMRIESIPIDNDTTDSQ